jgi:maleylpyruvate isomerase
MYASQEARDGDIDDLAAVAPTELRERFLASTGGFTEALEAMAPGDWDEDFCAVLLESLTKVATAEPFTVRPTDLDGSWRYGEGDGGPVVTGTAAALGWWLTGRGSGEGLTSDTGTLPEMEAW